MASPYNYRYDDYGRTTNSCKRERHGTFYLYLILIKKELFIFILGVSAFYHDSAACLLENDRIIAAAQEERFSRVKHDSKFPHQAIKYCLSEKNIKPDEIDYITFYEKPLLKFDRILETYLAFAPKGFKSFAASLPIWVKEKLFQKNILISELCKIGFNHPDIKEKLLFSEHHLSHAASAFYPSPFNNAAILTMDGVGEWTTTSLAIGTHKEIEIIKEIHFPHSLGLLYSAFTHYLGFKVNSGEYKVMGLAPYGTPKYIQKIKENLIDIADDGSFKLNLEYFDYCTGLTMTNKNFNRLFQGPARTPESDISQKEMDLAASIQKVSEEIILKLISNIFKETQQKNLCLAGGVALNCVANSKILKTNLYENIWVQPAAGDAGGALGAAFLTYSAQTMNFPTKSTTGDKMKGCYLGPSFTTDKIEEELVNNGAIFQKFPMSKIYEETSKALLADKAIGWMNGRMEFGPRALGARSIIANASSPNMQKNLNLKVKFRESFRPFAPSLIEEDLEDWFDLESNSPYMLLVGTVKKNRRVTEAEKEEKFGLTQLNQKRSMIPAVTHIDYTARVQTVNRDTNIHYYNLIKEFKKQGGCGVIINTSFNIRGEPIVCTPTDAYKCFMGTELDILVIENFFLAKELQSQDNIRDYRDKFSLD